MIRLLLAASLVATLGLAGVGAMHLGVVPPAYTPIPALDLSDRGGLLTDWQLVEVGTSPALCDAAVLNSPLIAATAVTARPMRDGCGWLNAVDLERVGDARVSVGPMDCGAAAAFALWVVHAVQPAAEAHLGSPVRAIDHYGTYSCRNVAGTRWRSVHARAAAIDVAGFTLANGRTVSLRRDWGNGPKGDFLAAVHKAACRYFRVTLGPDYNAAHADHFHLDRGWAIACR